MLKRFPAVLLIPLLAGCAGQVQLGPREIPVESYVLVDVEEANARVAGAAAAGEGWVRDPLAVAETVVGESFGRYYSVERVDERTERPRSTVVTLITGDYLDDSVWGTWNQILLSRDDAGVWSADEARRAWRCWRGHQRQSFGERLCL
jgi:hypothetical protein